MEDRCVRSVYLLQLTGEWKEDRCGRCVLLQLTGAWLEDRWRLDRRLLLWTPWGDATREAAGDEHKQHNNTISISLNKDSDPKWCGLCCVYYPADPSVRPFPSVACWQSLQAQSLVSTFSPEHFLWVPPDPHSRQRITSNQLKQRRRVLHRFSIAAASGLLNS